MKVTVNEKEKNSEIKYPCLMKDTKGGIIVLFVRHGEGTTVATSEKGYGILGHSNSLRGMDNYVPFTGSITLEND